MRSIVVSLSSLALFSVLLIGVSCSGNGSSGPQVAGSGNPNPDSSPTPAPSPNSSPNPSPSPTPANAPLAGILQWKGDNSGRGLYSSETILNPGNVNVSQFGKLAIFSADGTIMAQPLFIPNLDMGTAGTHNVLIAATEHDSVYAFDADHPGTVLWVRHYTDAANGITSLTSSISGRTTLGIEAGITGTPVIDPATGVMYFVTVIARNGIAEQWLRAVDVRTGKDFGSGSMKIQASVPGDGRGSMNGEISFDPLRENQRAGLREFNGMILLAWGSFSDYGTYHGWLMAYDARTLRQIAVFNSSPQYQATDSTGGPIAHGGGGSFWEGGAAPGIDSAGNIYVVAADGSFNADMGGRNYSDAVLKLRVNGNTFQVVDWFAPFNQQCINVANLDLGTGSVALLPAQVNSSRRLAVAIGKEGRLYLLDIDNLGRFNASGDTQIPQSLMVGNFQCSATTTGADDSPTWNRLYGNPSYWNGNLYAAPANGKLKQYQFQNGLLGSAPVAESATVYGGRGGGTVVSSNGNQEGILWAYEKTSTGHALLHAYDALGVSRELWNSDMNSTRDGMNGGAPFGTPVVVNGRVIAVSQNRVMIYGILR